MYVYIYIYVCIYVYTLGRRQGERGPAGPGGAADVGLINNYLCLFVFLLFVFSLFVFIRFICYLFGLLFVIYSA